MGCYQRLRDLREDNDSNQAEIAEVLSMQVTQYGRYERGDREIPFGVAIELAKYYNVSLDYLAGLTSEKAISGVRLSRKERELLEMFRSMSEFEQGQVYERAVSLLNNNK